MCGLAGLLAAGNAAESVRRAIAGLAHRGPDDEGLYTGDGVALAARRLSIIDLPGGHQPLSNEDGRVWIVYNGEVFNAPELRAGLAAAGHRFRTQSDTEAIVHAYEEWGEAAVARLRGMFAFALWDASRQKLLLARDRFGIKPLYYAQDGGRLAFASEIRPLFTLLPALSRQPDLEAMGWILQVGHAPAPRTAFAAVRKLPAAHLLVAEAGELRVEPYWQLAYPPDGQHQVVTGDEAAEAFAEQLRQTVDAWRLSDVPVGSLLSGGVDSGALAALLTELSGGPIHTFTIGFDAPGHDEAARARDTAAFLGSHHHELVFTPADFDRLPHAIRHLEQPHTSATSLPIYRLYQACHAAGFKVVMTGEGADELLGGYHWFDGDRRARPLLALPRPLRSLLARAPLPMSAAARRVLAEGGRDVVERYARWQENGAAADRATLLPGAPPSGSLVDLWRQHYGPRLTGRHPLDQFLLLEGSTRLVEFVNVEVDRMSMASSVEARPPFLDHRLWEFCAALPPSLRLPAGRGLAPAVNKWLLRRAMAGHLPESARLRPKQGLAAPHAAWWRSERLPAWAEECLHPAALAETGLFDAPTVARLRAEHQRGAADHSRLLTGVLTTQLWHDQFR